MIKTIDYIPGTKDCREKLLKNPGRTFEVRPLRDIRTIALHHSMSLTGSAESITRNHINKYGWPGIGYHFFIEKDGTAKWCNDLTVKCYHTCNNNKAAVEICLAGDFRKEVLDDRQQKPLIRLLRFLMLELDLTQDDVLGHSEMNGCNWIACPYLDMNVIRKGISGNALTAVVGDQSFDTFNTLLSPEMTFNPNNLITNPGESVIAAANRSGLFNLGEIKERNKSTDLKKPSKEPVSVKVTGPIEHIPDQVSQMIRSLEKKNHQVFKSDYKPYNLNIVGIRNADAMPNSFDDEIYVFWNYRNQWTFKKFKATTDPGLTYLLDPINKSGTAILKEGQYRGAYHLGLHHNQYTALVQAAPVTVIRDFNRDNKLDFNSGIERTGFFGINIHHASSSGESTVVNKWSAGCQVFAGILEYDEFIRICKCAATEWGERFTYTLINKKDLISN